MKKFGSILIVSAAAIVVVVAYRNNMKSKIPVIFSPETMLEDLWRAYKTNYWDASSGRTIDVQANGATTSEAQSYTMLRAVWQDDKTTFDAAWNWDQENLLHADGHLLSWLWGKRSDASSGILTDRGGENSASDADTDTAVALLFAYGRWHDPAYLTSARGIADDIWQYEVVTIQGKPVLVADNVERSSPGPVIVNPSYFAPYAYRMFARIDSARDWNGLIDNSYALLGAVDPMPLGASSSDNLPPDWITINRSTGAIAAVPADSLTSHFSYDAMRTPWRLALDWLWYREPRAKATLKTLGFLENEWYAQGVLVSDYAHDGTPSSTIEAPAIYGGTIGYFTVADPADAPMVYETKLASLFDPDAVAWRQKLSYYDDNWAWFGIGLYNNVLPNLASSIAPPTKNNSAPPA
ncbi:MAG TPA: glycosyl hydrolase family 8 [Candidatus Paceibacterota bacterium]|nr:glycosyl hydrolase family 8 [Candidatus Paceibacterota bacterium]